MLLFILPYGTCSYDVIVAIYRCNVVAILIHNTNNDTFMMVMRACEYRIIHNTQYISLLSLSSSLILFTFLFIRNLHWTRSYSVVCSM